MTTRICAECVKRYESEQQNHFGPVAVYRWRQDHINVVQKDIQIMIIRNCLKCLITQIIINIAIVQLKNQMEKLSEQSKNELLTIEARKDPKYHTFIKWLVDNGALLDPRLQYPVAFGSRGYIGVATNENIGSFEPLIAIPKKLIIDIRRVIQTKQLKKVTLQNKHMFQQQNQEDNNFNMMCLCLTYEKAKGDKCFFKPYFDAAWSGEESWCKKDLQQIQNKEVQTEIIYFQKKNRELLKKFQEIIPKYPSVFPSENSIQKYREYLKWSINFINTRAFGWTIPGIFLIPFGDMLNHGLQALDHEMFNVKDKIQKQTKKTKSSINPFVMFQTLIDSKKQKDQKTKSKQRTKLSYINKHKQFLEDTLIDGKSQKQLFHKIAFEQYKSGNKPFRKLVFDVTSCSQDNDSDTADVMTREYSKVTIKKNDKMTLKKLNPSFSLKDSLIDYWKVYKQNLTTVLVMQNTEMNPNQESHNSVDSLSKEHEFLSDESQNDKQSDQDEEQKDLYFLMFSTQNFKKGDQIFNFYGKRTNKFLARAYKFALIDNKYDSFCFRLYFRNHEMMPDSNIKILDYVESSQESIQYTRQIHIKRNRVSIELINHIRVMILSTFTNPQNIYGVPLTIPTTKFLQEKVLELCKKVIKHHLDKFSTSILDDQEIIKSKETEHGLLIAVIIRRSYKIILNEQLNYLDQCLSALHQFKNGRIKLQLKDMPKIEKIRQYINALDRSLL